MDTKNEGHFQLSYKNILTIIILFVLLGIYMLFIGIESVISSLFHANIILLIVALVIYYSSLFIRSFRWKTFLKALNVQVQEELDYRSIYSLITFSFALNNLFPLRLGELYRPYEYSRKKNYPLLSSYATVILERTLDVIIMAGLIISIAITQGVENFIKGPEFLDGLIIIVGIVLGFLSLLIVLSREESAYQLIKILNFVSGIIQKKIIQNERITAKKVASEVTSLVQNPRVIFLGCITSVAIWIMEGSVFWIVATSMNIDLSLFSATFILLLAGLIGNSVTSASGFGQLPFMIAQLVLLHEIPQHLALSVSIAYLFIVFWLIVPIGIFLNELNNYFTQ